MRQKEANLGCAPSVCMQIVEYSVSVCVRVCVYVCVKERERERKMSKEGEKDVLCRDACRLRWRLDHMNVRTTGKDSMDKSFPRGREALRSAEF